MDLQEHYKRIYWFAICVVMVVKIALVGWWPLLARMHEKTDSVLFIRRAIALLEGDWLGAYDYATLMKGPMTSFWIAATNYLGWPINFAREVLYLAACLLALKALSLICRSKWVLFVLFVFFVFLPASNAYGPLAALYRESIHLPITLAVQALMIILFVKYAKAREVHFYEAGLLGLFLLAFFLNREETPWIYPQLAWFSMGVVVVAWWRYRQSNVSVGALSLLKIFIIPMFIVVLGIEWVAQRNHEEYGIDAVLEINRPEFKSAYKGLMRIKPDTPAESAALFPDVIEKLLSLPKGNELNVPPFSSGRELNAMFVPWKFRSAIQKAGYYGQGGPAVLAFYEELGDELNLACESGRYACRPVLFGAIPVFDGIWLNVFTSMLREVSEVVNLHNITVSLEEYPSYGDTNYRRNLSLLTSAPIALTKKDRVDLPKYYTRMAKKKTSRLEELLSFYRLVLPFLAGVSVMILVAAMVRSIRRKEVGIQEFLMLGLFGGLLTQLFIFSLLSAVGLSTSIRLYFNTYPVLFLFIGISLIYLGQWVRGSLGGRYRD